MAEMVQRQSSRLKLLGLLCLVVVAALFSTHAAAQQIEPSRVHSAVLAWASENSDAQVPIIVQTAGDGDEVAAYIEKLGGEVERRFQIIPAIEANLPGSSLSLLDLHPLVSLVTLNAPIVSTSGAIDTDNLATSYPLTVDADDAWDKGYTGRGIGVAVVDTGISPSGHEDFKGTDGKSRVIAEVVVNKKTSNVTDAYGHGTHVAGIIGGDGSLLNSKYIGIAPNANLITVKVSDENGNATAGDVIAGLEWVYYNKSAYNIRVVNLSLSSSVAQSYKTDPLCAAAEFLWLNDIFVVATAGNRGNAPDATHYCPGNDPFVMTVGALDDKSTNSNGDDVPTTWSSYGITQDGFAKPNLLTPGRNIISVIDTNSILYKSYPDKIVDKDYFRLSGTSMSAGVMSGVVALVLEGHPNWQPGELKCTLIAEAQKLSGSYSDFRVPRAGNTINRSSPACNSNNGLTPSYLLAKSAVIPVGVIAYVLGEPDPKAAADTIGLDLKAAGIEGKTLGTVDWGTIKWNGIRWDGIRWDGIRWDGIRWDGVRWDGIRWDGIRWDFMLEN